MTNKKLLDKEELLDRIERVEIVSVQPGDVVVVSFDDFIHLADDEKQRLRGRFKAVFPNNQVIIFSHAEFNVFCACELPALQGDK